MKKPFAIGLGAGVGTAVLILALMGCEPARSQGTAPQDLPQIATAGSCNVFYGQTSTGYEYLVVQSDNSLTCAVTGLR